MRGRKVSSHSEQELPVWKFSESILTTEQAADRLVRNVTEGKYLSARETGTTVIGKAIAKRLDVTLGDDLIVTAADNEGQIESAMLQIVGIV